jgi:hypothetical protein
VLLLAGCVEFICSAPTLHELQCSFSCVQDHFNFRLS